MVLNILNSRVKNVVSWLLAFCLLVPGLAGAQNNAVVVAQTVPVNMVAGESYTLTMSFKNTGTTSWTSAGKYCAKLLYPTGWSITSRCVGTTIAVNGIFYISHTLVAPTTPGIYNYQWQMEQQGVSTFGTPSNNFSINVAARAPAAQFISENVPTILSPGTRQIIYSMKNTGNVIWKAGQYALVAQNPADNTVWGISRLPLTTASVAPGATGSFVGTITAPSTLGYYDMQWRPIEVGKDYIGEPTPLLNIPVAGPAPSVSVHSPTAGQTFIGNGGFIEVPVKVTAAPTGVATVTKLQILAFNSANSTYVEVDSADGPVFEKTLRRAAVDQTLYAKATDSFNKYTQTPFAIDTIVDNAQVVSHTIPTKMVPGVEYDVTVTMKNSGGTTWLPANVELVSQNPVGNTNYGISTMPLTTTVPPGGTAIFSGRLRAPASEGMVQTSWRLFEKTRTYFGASALVSVTIARELPVVSMTSPTASQIFEPATGTTSVVQVQGSATPGLGATISKLEVIEGTTIHATVNGSTINQAITLAAGNHTLRLRATDNWGEIGYSPLTTISVKANNADFLSQSATTTLKVGQQMSFLVTMRNSGSKPWSAAEGYALAVPDPQIAANWGMPHAVPAATVAAGAQATISIPIAAPMMPGTYDLQFRMLQDGREWFGEPSLMRQIVVKPELPVVGALTAPEAGAKFIASGGKAEVELRGSATPGQYAEIAKLEVLNSSSVVIATAQGGTIATAVQLLPGTHTLRLRATDNYGQVVTGTATTTITVGSNNATFVAATVPTTMAGGQKIPVSVSMRNSGTSTWTAEDGFRLLGVTPALEGTSVPLPGPIAPGATAQFDFEVVAPPDPGTYAFQWQMMRDMDPVELFGAKSLSKSSTVTIGAPPTTEIISPKSGETFTALNGTATVQVMLWGQVKGSATTVKHEVLDGTQVIASSNQTLYAPYVNLAPGQHSLQGRITDNRGAVATSNVVTVKVDHNQATFVEQSVPASMITGQRYPVWIKLRNSGSLSWQPTFVLRALNPVDNTSWNANGRVPLNAVVAPGGEYTIAFDVEAPQVGSHNFQWRLEDDKGAVISTETPNVAVAVGPVVLPNVEMAAAPGNVRVPPGQTATISLTGSSDVQTGQISKLEVFADSGAGYAAAPIKVMNGPATSLQLNEQVVLAGGSYRFKLRATDLGGRFAESAPVLVNVTDSPLLGLISGVRSNGAQQLQLVGWTCRDTSEEALSYDVSVHAPVALGGPVVASGIANVSAEVNDAAVRNYCHTPGASHHFVADLSVIATQYPGAKLYVQARASNGDEVVLPCDDNSCRMPESMRIGLTSPNASNADRFRAPAPAFLRAQVSGYTGALDEVAFFVGGEWIAGVAEGGGAYSVSKAGLASSTLPYSTFARVRQGGTTLITEERQFFIDAGIIPGTIAPKTGTIVGINRPTVLSTDINEEIPAGASVKFYIDKTGLPAPSALEFGEEVPGGGGTTVIGTATNLGFKWSYTWTPSQAGYYEIKAKLLDGSGKVLMETPPVTLAASASANPTSDIPVAVSADIAADLAGPDIGTLPGELAVGHDGAATYTIDIVVPPGTAGMQPSLSLNYSSAGGVGISGLGWSLGGQSSIHRCAKTMAQDGLNDRITISDSDRLCLDGVRLVRSNGAKPNDDQAAKDAAYWAADSEYRTEQESFSRISQDGTGFKVQMKDGTIRYYGTSAATAPPAQGRTDKSLQWMLAKVEDRSGNYLTWEYNYDASSGEITPKQIRYGANKNTALAPDLAVRFIYKPRPDIQTAYAGGSRNDTVNRLVGIQTFTDVSAEDVTGKLVRDYAIAYQESAATGRSLVKSIQVGAVHPNTGVIEKLPETKFEWADDLVVPQLVKGPQFSLPNFGSTIDGYPAGYREPQAMLANLDGTGRMSHVAVQFAACGKTDEPACRGQDVQNHATGLLRVHSPNGAPVDVRVDFSPLRSSVLAPDLIFGTSLMAPTSVEFADVDGDGRDDLVAIDESFSDTVAERPRFGVCLNSGAIGAPLSFTCIPGSKFLPVMVELQSDRKMHMLSPFDAQGNGTDCVYSSAKGTIECKPIKLNSQVTLPTAMNYYNLYNFFRPVGIRLGRQSMTDLYSVWHAEVPAADPANPHHTMWYYNKETGSADWKPVDLVHGVMVCFNRPEGLNCQEIARARSVGKVMTAINALRVADDLNGDGLTDFMYSVGAPKEYIHTGLGSTVEQHDYAFGIQAPTKIVVCLSKENGVDCKEDEKQFQPNKNWTDPVKTARAGDFLGDGVTRILFNVEPNHPGPADAKTELCYYTSSGLNCRDIPYVGSQIQDKWPISPAMVSDSGVPNEYVLGEASVDGLPTWHSVSLAAPPGQDRLNRVINGLGHATNVDYARGDDTSTYARHTAGGAVAWPVYPKAVALPGVMVKQVRRDNGKGGSIDTRFHYEGATYDVAGRDPFGFGKFKATDVANGITTTSTLHLDFPFAGEVKESETAARDSTVLNKTTADWKEKSNSFTNGGVTKFAYPETTTVVRKDLDGSDHSTAKTEDTYDNWGNLRVRKEYVMGGGKSFGSSVSTTYSNNENDWLLGLPVRVLTSKAIDEAWSVPRTVAYEYDALGRLSKETVEPYDSGELFKVEVTHSRAGNSFGLVTTSTQTWRDPDTRQNVTRKVKDVEYDNLGRFVKKAFNAMAQAESFTYSAGSGALTKQTDSNLLETNWVVDGFGRVRSMTGPDGHEIRHYTKRCVSNCPANSVAVSIVDRFHKDPINGEKRSATPVITYTDTAGHILRTLRFGFAGKRIYADVRYDDQGRESEVDQPRFDGASAYLASLKRYDDLGRVIEVEGRDDGGGTTLTKYKYEGLQTTIEDAKQRNEIRTSDVLGRLVKTVDRANGETSMGYDAFGNLAWTRNPNNNMVSMVYDRLGRRTALLDPDLGEIRYDVDPLGRVWKQTSANQKKHNETSTVKEFTRFKHDALNRMTARFETDLESHWVYDTAKMGKGKLAEAYTVSNDQADYRRLLSYDGKGRMSSTTQIIALTNYQFKPTYDDWGRVVSRTYLRDGGEETTFDLRYNESGYLARIEKKGRALWLGAQQDAFGNSVFATLGNGLVESANYNPFTGRMESKEVRLNGALKVMDSYQYDKLGNVSHREQHWGADQFVEDFGFDELNRLSWSRIGSQRKDFKYDAAGNVISKTGTGTGDYVYPPQGTGVARPHAVLSIPGVGSFDYDDNGNMKAGAGRIYEWTSFDMPRRITKGTKYSNFVYGPEHQRIVQRRDDGTSIVYTAEQEIELQGESKTPTSVKTYWPNGIGLEIAHADGRVEEHWFHRDRLGSPIAISNGTGNVGESLAYDPWGKRRTPDGSATPDSLDGVVDNKGFTGHEMLDQLDLVHMNGRVFDPLTARFVSGDPHITDPTDGQNYNRYSYVLNNPLGYTDPTGFDGRGIDWVTVYVAPTYGPGGQSGGGDESHGPSPSSGVAAKVGSSTNSAQGNGAVRNGSITSVGEQVIVRGIREQRIISQAVLDVVTRWNASDRDVFLKNFGTKSDSAKNYIAKVARRQLALKLSKDNFKFASQAELNALNIPTAEAYVKPEDPTHTIHVAEKFFSMSAREAGVVIFHELTHFNDIGHARDRFREYEDGMTISGNFLMDQFIKTEIGRKWSIYHSYSIQRFAEKVAK